MRTILITGSAGFIGFHLSRRLLEDGFSVVGYDSLNDYYDVGLKEKRHALLQAHPAFTCTQGKVEDFETLKALCDTEQPEVIIHLAAQAGVRYSLENPRAYIDANVVGTFNVMECARALQVKHLLMASTSSIYGANTQMPYHEMHKADHQMTIYAATKKAGESMGHAYAHLWNLPTTLFRLFTVYGPWGRPDMAYFKFVNAMLKDQPIDVYNHGNMYRDFTYVADVVQAIRLLVDTAPVRPQSPNDIMEGDSLSPVAPFRVVNIGNSEKVRLLDFIHAIEKALGKKAIRHNMDMQKGDVPATWADASLLNRLTGYRPQTNIEEGGQAFVRWYREYFNV
jgi:UDP-glucuronate 4-epimerase